MKGIADFKELVQQRTWDKDVLLWLGPEESLLAALGATKHVELDLLDLFQPDNLPTDDDATKDVLRLRLRERLRSIPNGPGNHTVLLVTSIGLLARYDTGLNEFYNWFVGSHALVVLLMESVPEKSEWPDEVRCEAKRLVGYFGDLTPSALRSWVLQARADRTKGRTGLTTAEREELARLRKENRGLRTERDILKKAAAFFAKHQQ